MYVHKMLNEAWSWFNADHLKWSYGRNKFNDHKIFIHLSFYTKYLLQTGPPLDKRHIISVDIQVVCTFT